ncbi:MAG: hypothetical protein JST53_01315 [Actinobacteria bacterium]|nr:hypothetical protein [Actinomycetota bacterium]
MAGPNTRRTFLRDLAGGALRKAPQLATGGLLGGSSPQPEDVPGYETRPAAMPMDLVSPEQLRELAVEHGLGRFEDQIAELAAKSLRLTAGGRDRSSTSFTGGSPRLPDPVEAERKADDHHEFLACIDLSSLDRRTGSLWVLSSLGVDDQGSPIHGAKLVVDTDPPPPAPPDARPLAVAMELTLPRPWSAQVAELDLGGAETEAWGTLRDDLAATQRVPTGDSLPRSVALHRVFGYPDERRGDMPLACELAARGFELGSEPARSHPEATALEADSTRWRMALQLSRDDELDWRWGPSFERLYLWTTGCTLEPGTVLPTRTIVQ